MHKWTSILFIISLLISHELGAESREFIGSLPVVLSSDELKNSSLEGQTVYVQEIRLSASAKRILSHRLDEIITYEEVSPLTNAPKHINLGMNGTPVLNQGAHGSCITFAMTAAMDAILGKGDYISQLCSLGLGKFLKRNGYIASSGWNGSYGSAILKQLAQYGIVSKAYQKELGCAGLKRYPLNSRKNTGSPMSIREYSMAAEPMSYFASWQQIVDVDDTYTPSHNPIEFLHIVKSHLREGNRVAFGILLDVDQGHAGALGTYRSKFDAWVLTPRIKSDVRMGALKAGHEMLIYGYDDDAEIYYKGELLAKGAFLVRNSWGDSVGNNGDFYVSYDYFKALCDEAQVVIPLM